MNVTTENKVIRQNYDYIFLSDILDILQSSCGIIRIDKKLNRLFTGVTDYINSCLPPVDGDIIDFAVFITVGK